MAEYKLIGQDDSDGVIRVSDGANIPAAEDNINWQNYVEWRDAGGIADPAYTLEQGKDYAKTVVYSQYMMELGRPLMHTDGETYPGDLQTRTMLNGYVLSSGGDIWTVDHKVVSLNASQVVVLINAFSARDTADLAALQSEYAIIDSAVDVSSLWPFINIDS